MSLQYTAYVERANVPDRAALQAAVPGFDCKIDLSAFPNLVGTVGSRDVAVTFRSGGDMSECACVLIVSAAFANAFGAIVHYQDDNTW